MRHHVILHKTFLFFGLLILTPLCFPLDIQEVEIIPVYPRAYYWISNDSLAFNTTKETEIYNVNNGARQVISEGLTVENSYYLYLLEMNTPHRPTDDPFIFFKYMMSAISPKEYYAYSIEDDLYFDIQNPQDLQSLKERSDFDPILFFSYWGFKKTGERGDKSLALKKTNLIDNSSSFIDVLKVREIPDQYSGVRNYTDFHFYRDSKEIFFHDSGATGFFTGSYEENTITEVIKPGIIPEGIWTGSKVIPLSDDAFLGYCFRFYPTESPVFSPFVFNASGEILFRMDQYFNLGDLPFKLSPDGRHIAFFVDKPEIIHHSDPEYGCYEGGESGLAVFRILQD